jgi:Jag N-terminus
MKSVVVQGSTVAKAIEAAWLKAGKPEEYFIRVLQEHSSGFLGFGAQKAKIVLFFKNTNKSDSLIPTVLKQKEYMNFFGNKNLKNPTELDIVDFELNKNTIIHNEHKKKPHQNQQVKHQQQKTSVTSSSVQGNQGHAKIAQVAKPVQLQKIATHNNVQAQQVKSMKIAQVQQGQEQLQSKNQQHKIDRKPSIQVSLQAPAKPLEQKKVVQQVAKKEDVVSDMTKVLKKVQSQKIVANVSRPSLKASADAARPSSLASDFVKISSDRLSDTTADKLVHEKLGHASEGKQKVSTENKNFAPKHQTEKVKVVTPKFESYAEFMDAQADKAAAKIQAAGEHIEKTSISSVQAMADKEKMTIHPVDSIVSKIESLHLEVVASKPATVLDHSPVIVEKPAPQQRPFIKMKRRPLTTDNPGVSGITRSSDKKQSDDVVQVQVNHVEKKDNE